MRDAPRLRGPLLLRVPSLFAGLFLIALAIVSMLQSRLGVPPWDVLHVGLANHSVLSIGTASIVVGLVVLAIAWALRARLGFGTVANAVCIGLFVQVLLSMGSVTRLSRDPLAVRAALLLGGVAVFGVGTALYVGAGLGAGPRDSMMLVVSRRSGKRIAIVRAAIEVCVLAIGLALGGPLGVGTVAFAVLIGPSVEACFWLLTRAGLTVPAGGEPAFVEGE